MRYHISFVRHPFSKEYPSYLIECVKITRGTKYARLTRLKARECDEGEKEEGERRDREREKGNRDGSVR